MFVLIELLFVSCFLILILLPIVLLFSIPVADVIFWVDCIFFCESLFLLCLFARWITLVFYCGVLLFPSCCYCFSFECLVCGLFVFFCSVFLFRYFFSPYVIVVFFGVSSFSFGFDISHRL